jgi:hypothetical protein
LCSEIHKLISSVWNKEELPQDWKESISVPVHNKGYKTDCSNYQDISLLLASYKILSSMLLSRLSPHLDKITGYHQYGFQRNRPITDQIFMHSSDTGEKMGVQWECASAIHRFQESLLFS